MYRWEDGNRSQVFSSIQWLLFNFLFQVLVIIMFVNWSVAKYDDPNNMNLQISFNCNYYFIVNILIEYLLVNIYETNYEYDDKSTLRSPVAIYWKLNVGTKDFWLKISWNSCLFNINKFVYLWMAYIERNMPDIISC